jgi:hypothetical protein
MPGKGSSNTANSKLSPAQVGAHVSPGITSTVSLPLRPKASSGKNSPLPRAVSNSMGTGAPAVGSSLNLCLALGFNKPIDGGIKNPSAPVILTIGGDSDEEADDGLTEFIIHRDTMSNCVICSFC